MILRILFLTFVISASPSLGKMNMAKFIRIFEDMCFQNEETDPFRVNGQDKPLSNTLENFIGLAEKFEAANPSIDLKQELKYFLSEYVFENIQFIRGRITVWTEGSRANFSKIDAMWDPDVNGVNSTYKDPFSDAEKCSLFYMISHSILEKGMSLRQSRSHSQEISSFEHSADMQELNPDDFFPQEMGVVAIRGTDAAVSLSKVLQGLFVGLKENRTTDITLNGVNKNLLVHQHKLPENKTVDALYAVTLADVLMRAEWSGSHRQGLSPDGEWVSIPINSEKRIEEFCPMVYLQEINNGEKHLPAYSYSSVRGAADGLILGLAAHDVYVKKPNSRLSQILRMYYSLDGISLESVVKELKSKRITFCNRQRLVEVLERKLPNQMKLYGFLVAQSLKDVDKVYEKAMALYESEKDKIFQNSNSVGGEASKEIGKMTSSEEYEFKRNMMIFPSSFPYGDEDEYDDYERDRDTDRGGVEDEEMYRNGDEIEDGEGDEEEGEYEEEIADYCHRPYSIEDPVILQFDTYLDVIVVMDSSNSKDSFHAQQMIAGYLANYLDLRYTGSRMTILLDHKIRSGTESSSKIQLKPVVFDTYSSSGAACTVAQIAYEQSSDERYEIITGIDQLLQDRKENEAKLYGVNGKVVVIFNYENSNQRGNEKIQGNLEKALRDLHLRHQDTIFYAVGLDSELLKRYAKNDPSLVILGIDKTEEEVAEEIFQKISLVPALLQYSECTDEKADKAVSYESLVSPYNIQHFAMPAEYFYKSLKVSFKFESQRGNIRVCYNRATVTPENEKKNCKNTTGNTFVEFNMTDPCEGFYKETCAPFYFSVIGLNSSEREMAADIGQRHYCSDLNDKWCATLDQIKFKISHTGVRCSGCLALGAPPAIILFVHLLICFIYKRF